MSHRNEEIARRWLAGGVTYRQLSAEYYGRSIQKVMQSALREAQRAGETDAATPSAWRHRQNLPLREQLHRRTLPWE